MKRLPKRARLRQELCYTFTMSEDLTNDFEDEADDRAEANREKTERDRQVAEIVALARELSERREGFSFPGLERAVYLTMKADEEKFPGYGTPVDEIVKKLEEQGMKVVFGKKNKIVTGADIEGSNVHIMPAQSTDIVNESVLPRQLKIVEGMDSRLRKLIDLAVEWKQMAD